ncbi:MAG: ferrochelatase [Bdellovibrionaceae bacterium]|nr:ferrochelatase [Pseudobdellovibrionaceae bacterium]
MNKKALLIINLGSPASSKVEDVKPYLNQFLMDGEVIDIFYPLRAFLVKGLIVPFRAKKSSEAYKEIFSERGSPLLFHTKDFVEKLGPKVQPNFQCVEYAMRYGEPSIESKIKELHDRGCSDLVVLPMYPQFAKSSTRTVLKEIQRVLGKIKATEMNVRTWVDFFSEDFFIQSFVSVIKEEMESFKPDHLLLSYHGLPESHVKEFAPNSCFRTPHCCSTLNKGNRLCYRAQCFETSRKIHSKLPPIDFTVSFQSRLGRQEWIKPYTDLEIEKILEKGAKRVLVACPAFVADCLETLEEISIRLRDDFKSKGGEDLKLVPSLNSREDWVDSCAQFFKTARFQPLLQTLNKVQ